MTNIPAVPTVFPPQNTPIVDNNGALTNAAMALLRDFYNRTGAGTGIFNSVGSVSGAVLPAPLNFDINVVDAGFAGDTILFNMKPGQAQMVVNRSGNPVNVDPPAGGSIDGAGAYNLASGKSQIYTCLEIQGQIISLQLG